jgi:hypothetical protein
MKRQNRTSESSPSDSEECEEPGLIATDGENTDSGAECWHCSGCILETDGAQNATSGAIKSVQVQTTAKCVFAVSATLNKCCAYLP